MNIRKGLKKSSSFQQSLIVLAVLWLALILSAFAVIYVTYDARVKFNFLEMLRREKSQLQVIWGQYLLEESAWAGYGRIEKLAKIKLLMKVPDPTKIIMVTP